MEETPSYVLPSDTEKLSHKYILDSLRARRQDQAISEAVQEAAAAAAEVPAEVVPAPEPMGVAEPEPEVEPEAEVPPGLPVEKRYFRIAEVSTIVGVKPHVLRYWETEFTMIRPSKSGGQRVYRRKDVETLQLIKHLLHVEKLGIRRARKKVLEHRKRARAALEKKIEEKTITPPPVPQTPAVNTQLLQELAQELRELVRLAQQS